MLTAFHFQARKVHSPNLLKRSEVVRIGSIIIFHLGKLWRAKFFILCDVLFLVRRQGKFEIDHSCGCWTIVGWTKLPSLVWVSSGTLVRSTQLLTSCRPVTNSSSFRITSSASCRVPVGGPSFCLGVGCAWYLTVHTNTHALLCFVFGLNFPFFRRF